MGKPSRVVVLAEDQIHQQFIRRYLLYLKYTSHQIYMVDLPSGRGCGEQWVRDRYTREVRACRKRSARAATAVVVVIDADKGDAARRLQQFERALTEGALPPRERDEKIAHLVPRRNIETWILCLNGISVDEERDYKGMPGTEQIPAAAKTFFDWTRPNATVPANCIPSILSAIPEIRRIE